LVPNGTIIDGETVADSINYPVTYKSQSKSLIPIGTIAKEEIVVGCINYLMIEAK